MDSSFEEAAAYEAYIGRWSRVVAREFTAWLAVPTGATWCDVACGTGALTAIALESYAPARVDASDSDADRIAFARRTMPDSRAHFVAGDGAALAATDDTYDCVVNGLGFPAIRDTARALAEFRRVVKPGGTVAAYVWDFDGQMQMLRYFWNAANAFEPEAEDEDDSERFAICHPERLGAAWHDAGFSDVAVRAIDASAHFASFDDFWNPFLRGEAPAQTHVRSLDDARRNELRERLRATLPIERDGSIDLVARAWAAKGRKTR